MAAEKLSLKTLKDNLDTVVESFNDTVDGLGSRIEEQGKKTDEKFDQILKAISNPVSFSKTVDAQEQDLGKVPTLTDSNFDVNVAQEVDSPEFKSKADNLAFAAELVEVHISETHEKDADPHFDISVGGQHFTFRRGETKRVPRYVVEGLARAKPVNYQNEHYTDRQGNEAYRHPATRGLRYPFSVVSDPNPRGASWLKRVLSEP